MMAAGDTDPASRPVPRIVILGTGFDGLTAARALSSASVSVTLIDAQNYHLFQPLLYQVATAILSPADIATPIRSTLRDQANAHVLLGEVIGIDRTRRIVSLDDWREVPYEYLIVATGARHAYFGHDDWEPVAPGLKKSTTPPKFAAAFCSPSKGQRPKLTRLAAARSLPLSSSAAARPALRWQVPSSNWPKRPCCATSATLIQRLPASFLWKPDHAFCPPSPKPCRALPPNH